MAAMDAELLCAAAPGLCSPAPHRYDPWRDLRENWPHFHVVVEPMAGLLLGWIRAPVIGLRAGTTSGQRRSTLAHEIVHLERGITDCGLWSAREERQVHAVAARRLVTIDELTRVVAELGGTHDLAALAGALEVDRETLRVRLRLLTAQEHAGIAERMSRVWSAA
ncbi:MAG TPA: ImmA/IrrE family metallo-endopeptidase [Jatrophihabitantaceae bacterium]|jgi:hypothetical protein|nr:ImmA/IrrE family metallo-endopeptidase [Jatrophihabitantaceae bacterium]